MDDTARTASGEDGLTTAERQGLALDHLGMARDMAKARRTASHDFREDLIAEAYLALAKAAARFRPELKVPFGVYASRLIAGALTDAVRKLYPRGLRKRPGAARVESLRAGHEGRGTLLLARPPRPVGAETEFLDLVEVLSRPLPRPHAAVIRAKYVDGAAILDLAPASGYGLAWCHHAHQKALRQIRENPRTRSRAGV